MLSLAVLVSISPGSYLTGLTLSSRMFSSLTGNFSTASELKKPFLASLLPSSTRNIKKLFCYSTLKSDDNFMFAKRCTFKKHRQRVWVKAFRKIKTFPILKQKKITEKQRELQLYFVESASAELPSFQRQKRDGKSKKAVFIRFKSQSLASHAGKKRHEREKIKIKLKTKLNLYLYEKFLPDDNKNEFPIHSRKVWLSTLWEYSSVDYDNRGEKWEGERKEEHHFQCSISRPGWGLIGFRVWLGWFITSELSWKV